MALRSDRRRRAVCGTAERGDLDCRFEQSSHRFPSLGGRPGDAGEHERRLYGRRMTWSFGRRDGSEMRFSVRASGIVSGAGIELRAGPRRTDELLRCESMRGSERMFQLPEPAMKQWSKSRFRGVRSRPRAVDAGDLRRNDPDAGRSHLQFRERRERKHRECRVSRAQHRHFSHRAQLGRAGRERRGIHHRVRERHLRNGPSCPQTLLTPSRRPAFGIHSAVYRRAFRCHTAPGC